MLFSNEFTLLSCDTTPKCVFGPIRFIPRAFKLLKSSYIIYLNVHYRCRWWDIGCYRSGSRTEGPNGGRRRSINNWGPASNPPRPPLPTTLPPPPTPLSPEMTSSHRSVSSRQPITNVQPEIGSIIDQTSRKWLRFNNGLKKGDVLNYAQGQRLIKF